MDLHDLRRSTICRGLRPRSQFLTIAVASLFAVTAPPPLYAESVSCSLKHSGTTQTFPDGAILMRTKLAVNPDGAVASYTAGDHGYTYISNGVNLHEGGRKISCSAKGANARCQALWRRAEAGGFGPGTATFCVFAMEVEPLRAGGEKVRCEGANSDRFLVGDGNGRPKSGPTVTDIGGGAATAYASTTSLRHRVNGETVYVDSAAIPGLVVPTSRPGLLGSVVWVRYEDHEGFAIVNDTGPAFGEGSVALHQLLHTGKVGPLQPVGPIPLEQRCSAVETGLRPPFVSYPDLGKGDKCVDGRKVRGAAEIRAYSGIDSSVVSIILPVKPPIEGHVVTEEISLDRLRQLALSAGYSLDKLHRMADCLGH
jgi:hypothetical protein